MRPLRQFFAPLATAALTAVAASAHAQRIPQPDVRPAGLCKHGANNMFPLEKNSLLDVLHDELAQKAIYQIWQIEGTGTFGNPPHLLMNSGNMGQDNRPLMGTFYADYVARPTSYLVAYANNCPPGQKQGTPSLTVVTRASFGTEEEFKAYVKADDENEQKTRQRPSRLADVTWQGPGSYITHAYRLNSPTEQTKLDPYAYLKAKTDEEKNAALAQFDPRTFGLPLDLGQQVSTLSSAIRAQPMTTMTNTRFAKMRSEGKFKNVLGY